MVTSASVLKRKINRSERKSKLENLIQQIASFLETDECSRLCPGKNEYVKKNEEAEKNFKPIIESLAPKVHGIPKHSDQLHNFLPI